MTHIHTNRFNIKPEFKSFVYIPKDCQNYTQTGSNLTETSQTYSQKQSNITNVSEIADRLKKRNDETRVVIYNPNKVADNSIENGNGNGIGNGNGNENDVKSTALKSGKKYSITHIDACIPDKYLKIDNKDKRILDKIIPNTFIRYVTHDGVYRLGHLKSACWKNDRKGDLQFFWMVSKGFCRPFPWRMQPMKCKAIYIMRKIDQPMYAYTNEYLYGDIISDNNNLEKRIIPVDGKNLTIPFIRKCVHTYVRVKKNETENKKITEKKKKNKEKKENIRNEEYIGNGKILSGGELIIHIPIERMTDRQIIKFAKTQPSTVRKALQTYKTIKIKKIQEKKRNR